MRDRRRTESEAALLALFDEMKSDVLARWTDGVKRLIAARWDRDLAAVILEQNVLTASEVADRVAKALGADYDPAVMTGWLEVNARISGENINAHTADQIRSQPAEITDPVSHVFGILATSDAAGIAQQMVTTSAGFAASDAATKSGATGKTWKVNSTNPRAAHARMNGQTVGIGETFSNGMQWPGDPAGGADNNARCRCSVTIHAGEG